MKTSNIATVFKGKPKKRKILSISVDSDLIEKLKNANVDIAQTCRNALLRSYHEVKGTLKRSG